MELSSFVAILHMNSFFSLLFFFLNNVLKLINKYTQWKLKTLLTGRQFSLQVKFSRKVTNVQPSCHLKKRKIVKRNKKKRKRVVFEPQAAAGRLQTDERPIVLLAHVQVEPQFHSGIRAAGSPSQETKGILGLTGPNEMFVSSNFLRIWQKHNLKVF